MSNKILCSGKLETRKLVLDAFKVLLRKCRHRGAKAPDIFHVHTNLKVMVAYN